MSTWMLLRLAKLLSVVLLAGGIAGGLLPRDLHERRRAVYYVATPGFVLSWVFGYALAGEMNYSLGSTWLSASMLLSLTMLHVLAWGVERADRGRALVGGIVVVTLIATVTLMTLRPGTRVAAPDVVAEAAP